MRRSSVVAVGSPRSKVGPSDIKMIVASGGWGDRIGTPTLHTDPGRDPVLGSRFWHLDVPRWLVQPRRQTNTQAGQGMPGSRGNRWPRRNAVREAIALGFCKQLIPMGGGKVEVFGVQHGSEFAP